MPTKKRRTPVLIAVVVTGMVVLVSVVIAIGLLALFPPSTTIHLNGQCQDLYHMVGKSIERVRVCP